MRETHPIMLYYKETKDLDFPLILFVGREPNGDVEIKNIIGEHNFDDYPNCAFWNTSYGVVANVLGVSTSEIKELFRKRKSSCIVFSDSLPCTILNKVKDKFSIREKILEENIINHINDIFSLEISKRIKLIVLSGLQDKGFQI
jgi:hypothetical protein